MKYVLKPHQREALAFSEKVPKCMLMLDMGLGKTAIACSSIKKGERVLIIVPASLKLNWKRELAIWSNTSKVTIIKKKSEDLPKGPGVVIINYDLLGKKIKKRAYPNYDFSGFDKVVLDECHMIKNVKAVRTKICGRIIKKTPRAILLSGTPMERPIDLYVPLFSIGAIDMSYDSFGHKFCDAKQVYLGFKMVWQFRGLSNPTMLKHILKPYSLRMLKEDVMDLPDKTIDIVSLDLPKGKQEKTYDIGAILKDPRPLGFEGLAEVLKEQGIRKVPLAVKHIKMRLETNQKVFVTAKHRDVIDALMEKLKDYNPVKLDGRDKAEEKQKAVDTFQTDETCRVFIGQNIAAGTGLTLTASNHVVLVEPDWSYSALMQLIDRVHRIGQTENVTAELLTISDSIDERVLFTTLEKKGYTKEVIGL